ncbi:OmpA family protein [Jannaschia ovalis]|uniref:OmpA family protein n=1 Tax=Jannaschia ovalis TaxID=3038773 RepID=A0ABY8LAP7_9RHOB|nr:OmpA family protein [Jannaschia sp. GRR-S6-38]WGH77248.1 OmpA family protein [Jannaschia sp. GRR-S6-38]
MRAILALVLTALPALAAAPELPLPGTPSLTEAQPLSTHRIATGPYAGGLPVEAVEGAVTRRIWQVEAPGATTLQILAPLRDALQAAGWQVVFECATRACGGFDFRFEIDVTPAPTMFVDLADYRYLAASKDAARLSMLVSTSGDLAYVQVTDVDPGAEVAAITKSASDPRPAALPAATGDIARDLRERGRAVLADLDFATGSTELAGDSYASLDALAAWMRANPETRVALVGHTDAEGSAEGNMAISRSRADSARAILTGPLGIAPARLETQGVGFFAPLAANDSPAGREANRRVEAVVISTE